MPQYGEETQRAEGNFPLHHKRTDLRLIYAIADVKKAAAQTYRELGIKPQVYQASHHRLRPHHRRGAG
ncbi:MAG: hypothetical protein LKE39_00305 [Sphaerochaeta sp.]|jgi:aspartate ammonia-lyase|nr:hypothetical protein [Sphaerochaeta sp.]